MTEAKSEDLRLDHIGNPKPIPLNAMESGRTDRDSDLGDDSPMVSFNFIIKHRNHSINSIRFENTKLIFLFQLCKVIITFNRRNLFKVKLIIL